MIGWAAEASGDLDLELAVRQSLSDECRRRRTAATTDGRSSAPGITARRAASTSARSRRRPTRRALATSYQRMRFRTTPEIAGGASLALRPAGVGVARAGGRVAAVRFAPQRRGVRLARRFVRLEREPGRRAERAPEARRRHRSARRRCWPWSIGGVADGVRRRAIQHGGGHRRVRGRAADPARRLSVRRPGGRRRLLWSFMH